MLTMATALDVTSAMRRVCTIAAVVLSLGLCSCSHIEDGEEYDISWFTYFQLQHNGKERQLYVYLDHAYRIIQFPERQDIEGMLSEDQWNLLQDVLNPALADVYNADGLSDAECDTTRMRPLIRMLIWDRTAYGPEKESCWGETDLSPRTAEMLATLDDMIETLSGQGDAGSGLGDAGGN
jgi:hypothetical protein